MLNNAIDINAIKHIYQDKHWVVINDILDPASAETIYKSLCGHTEWDLCSYGPYASGAISTPQVDSQVDNDAYRVVKQGKNTDEYSFRYYGHSLHKRVNKGLSGFLDYISAKNDFSTFITEVTDDNTINFVSPQATYFDAGCFLRTHNDFHSVNGVQTRKIAFVFGYTKDWPADWGGAFHILDDHGNIIDSQKPRFNTLTLFKVPTIHYVSPVAAYATRRRYAISGWFMNNPQAR